MEKEKKPEVNKLETAGLGVEGKEGRRGKDVVYFSLRPERLRQIYQQVTNKSDEPGSKNFQIVGGTRTRESGDEKETKKKKKMARRGGEHGSVGGYGGREGGEAYSSRKKRVRSLGGMSCSNDQSGVRNHDRPHQQVYFRSVNMHTETL